MSVYIQSIIVVLNIMQTAKPIFYTRYRWGIFMQTRATKKVVWPFVRHFDVKNWWHNDLILSTKLTYFKITTLFKLTQFVYSLHFFSRQRIVVYSGIFRFVSFFFCTFWKQNDKICKSQVKWMQSKALEMSRSRQKTIQEV